MRGIPPDISIVNQTHAKCWRCGTVMVAAEPWQLLDLCRRHTAESHPTAPASAPPLPASAVLPPAG